MRPPTSTALKEKITLFNRTKLIPNEATLEVINATQTETVGILLT